MFVALATALPALAEDAPVTVLPAVVVTAEKVPQDARQVPISISVLDGDTLQASGVLTTDGVSRYAANTDFYGALLYIRGIGSSSLAGFDPSVGVFVDGVYFGRATAALTPLLDLEQIEVLRGPQGTVLGKNTIGGALSLVTRPPADRAEGYLESGPQSRSGYTVQGAGSLPLNAEVSARVAVLADHQDGFVFNSMRDHYDESHDLRAARIKLALDSSSFWTSWLSCEFDQYRNQGFSDQLSAATPASLRLFRLYDPATEARVDGHTALDAPEGGDRKAGNLIFSNAFDFDGLRLTSLSSFAGSDVRYANDGDYSPVPLITQSQREHYQQFSEELRIDGKAGDLDFLAGLYLLQAHLDVDNLIVALPDGSAGLVTGVAGLPFGGLDPAALLPPALTQADLVADQSIKTFAQHASTVSLFGQSTWHLTGAWSLTGGLRGTDENKRVHATNAFQHSGVLFRQLLGEQPYDSRRRRTELDVSPKAALQYRWPRSTAYLAFSSGHKSGGYNDLAASPATLEYAPESSQNAELGLKSTWLKRRLSLDADLFYTRYRNLQVEAFDGTRFYIANAAQAAIKGAELESRARPLGWLSIRASGAFLDARYTSYPNAPARREPASTAGASNSTQDLAGRPLVRAPRWSATLGLELQRAVAGAQCVFGLDALYRDRAYLNLNLDPIDVQPSVIELNARVSVIWQHWSLRVSATNLTDQTVRATGQDIALFPGDHVAQMEPGRSIVGTLAYRW